MSAPSTVTAPPPTETPPPPDQILLDQPMGRLEPVNSASTAGVRIPSPPLVAVTAEHEPVPEAKSAVELSDSEADGVWKVAGLAGAVAVLPSASVDVTWK